MGSRRPIVSTRLSSRSYFVVVKRIHKAETQTTTSLWYCSILPALWIPRLHGVASSSRKGSIVSKDCSVIDPLQSSAIWCDILEACVTPKNPYHVIQPIRRRRRQQQHRLVTPADDGETGYHHSVHTQQEQSSIRDPSSFRTHPGN